MDEILLLAERLGKAISESPQAAALRAARDAMQGQADLQQMLKDYQAQAEAVRGPAPVRHAVAHFSLILVNCDADPVEAHVDARKEVP